MAGCIACLTLPVFRYLRARMSRGAAVTVYAAGLAACLLVPLTTASLLIAPQAASGIRRLNQWRASGWAISPELTEYLASIRLWLMKIPGLHEWIEEMGANLNTIINTVVRNLVSGGLGLAGGTVTAVWMVVLFVILSTLGVVYAPAIHKVALRTTLLSEASLGRLVRAIRSALRAVVVGVFTVALVQGLLCGIAFRVAGVTDPAFWGLLATFAAVVPLVGTALVWVPVAVTLWFTGATYSAAGLTVWCMVAVAGSDNFLRPWLLKTGIEASIFVLLLSILCAITVFGPVGIIAGPVLVAVSLQAMKESDLVNAPPDNQHADPQ